MQPQLTPSPYPRQRPAPCAPDFLSEDLIADAVASRPSDREPRHDGWTPDRIRMFLKVLSQCGVVEDAARACGMSKQGAYNFRNSARGRAFDVAWRSAQLLARNRIADDVMSRAIHGCREVIIRDGEVWGERHRFDNRLTMAVLKRLDDLATPHVGQIDQAPRRVAHEFEALVDAVSAGGEEGMAFIQSRCALRYEDFEEQRILERNQAYAHSHVAGEEARDEWEPETSSTSATAEAVDQAQASPLPHAGGAGMGIPTPQHASQPEPAEPIEPHPTVDECQPETSSTSAAEEPTIQAPDSPLPLAGGDQGVGIPTPQHASQPEPAEPIEPHPTEDECQPETSSTSTGEETLQPFGLSRSKPPTPLQQQGRRKGLRPAQAERAGGESVQTAKAA